MATIFEWDGGTLPSIAGTTPSVDGEFIQFASGSSENYLYQDVSSLDAFTLRYYIETPSAYAGQSWTNFVAMSSTNWRFRFNIAGSGTPGQFMYMNASNTQIDKTAQYATALSTIYRIEMQVDRTAQTMRGWVFPEGSDFPLFDTGLLTGFDTGNTSFSSIRIGRVVAISTGALKIGRVKLTDDSATLVGRHASDTGIPRIKGISWDTANNKTVRFATHSTTSVSAYNQPLATGDWVIIIANNNSNTSGTPTTPSWGRVWRNMTTVGAMAAGAWYTINDGRTTYSLEECGYSSGSSWMAIWGDGADPDLDNWVVGSWQDRASLPDGDKTTLARAPGITSPTNSLVLLSAVERTVALETGAPGMYDATAIRSARPSVNNFSRLFWRNLGNASSGGGWDTMGVFGVTTTHASKVIADETVKFQNTHNNNGTASMLAIPASDGEIIVGPTGNIKSTFVPKFSHNSLTVGSIFNIDFESCQATFTPATGDPTVVEVTTIDGYGYAKATGLSPNTTYTITFTIDDVDQTDKTLTIKTLPTPGSRVSFVADAGSGTLSASGGQSCHRHGH